MKKYVIFNFLVQFFILFISVNMFFDSMNIKLLYSLFIIGLIFVLDILEFIYKFRIKRSFHYLITIICLLLFIILIAF